ncbi:MAG: hypothetical protein K2Y10_03930 [Burkholderiaceae bacterium]|nr:hypothetical protein [Burkholderiaceae bacterium]
MRLELNARPCFALLRCGLLFSALAGVSLASHAAGTFKNATLTGGHSINWFPSTAPNTPTNGTITPNVGWLPVVTAGPSNVPIVKQSLPLPINNKDVVIDVQAKVKGGAQLSSSVIKFGKLLPVVGNVIAAAELVDFLKDTFGSESLSLKNNNGQLEADIVTKTIDNISGKEFSVGNGWNKSPDEACKTAWPGDGEVTARIVVGYVCQATWTGIGYNGTVVTIVNRWQISISSRDVPCPSGWVRQSDGSCEGQGATNRTVTEQEIADKIASSSAWPSSAAPLIRKMLQSPGVEVPTDPASTATSGPSSVSGPKTTATEPVPLVPGTNTPAAPATSPTDPGTKTTTTTSTTNITYQGDKIIYNTTNKTESSITNNTTNITINNNDTKTQTIENEPPPKEDPKDPCEIDPERIGCSKYGTPPEPGELPKKDQSITITPVDLGGAGLCPPPIPFSVFGRSYALSYQPACDVATYAKTVVLLIASVIAGYVFVGGLKA